MMIVSFGKNGPLTTTLAYTNSLVSLPSELCVPLQWVYKLGHSHPAVVLTLLKVAHYNVRV